MLSCVPQAEHTSRSVSRQFFSRFHSERIALLTSIHGIPIETERAAYASLLLNRLLFLYFLQKHGLLDHDPSYLPHHLHHTQQHIGHNAFYRTFLLPLFHEQLNGTSAPQPSALFGRLPALHLPLFYKHPLEDASAGVQIADAAFEQLFSFFESYHWQLEHRTSEAEHALHPSLLSTLFERQLDRKQMGAYYTQEDVTHYITSNTLLPCLLASVEALCPLAFTQDGEVWRLLQRDPARYLHAAVLSSTLLPAETVQECQVRQAHSQELQAFCRAGHLTRIADLVTHNLDIMRMTQDSIAHTEDAALLYAFYSSIEHMRVLDPTCGSGAFLLTALHILAPLYLSCLDRMQTLLHEYTLADEYAERFRALLQRADEQPSRRYFALSESIRHNLYGVDIMEEAVQICRQSLLLALLAEVERIEDATMLPELDAHIRVGNALLGHVYANAQAETPQHEHFHWFSAFPDVMEQGGFDVIIGNPPYVEYSRARQNYMKSGSGRWGNLYAAVIERSLELCRPGASSLGLVVPLSLCGSVRFSPLRASLVQQTSSLWLANFDIFPSRLFEGAYQRLSILLARHGTGQQHTLYVTQLQRWFNQERPHLIDVMTYTRVAQAIRPTQFPRLASPLQEHILHRIASASRGGLIDDILQSERSEHFVYYQEATNYWTKATCRVPFYKKNGTVMEPAHGRFLYFSNEAAARVVMALLNSSLFFVWFATFADGFHLAHTLVREFPLDQALLCLPELPALALRLEEEIKRNARMGTRNTHKGDLIEIEEYRMGRCKACLDEIDTILARHYNFTAQELAFLINYDSKYRMRQENDGGDIEHTSL